MTTPSPTASVLDAVETAISIFYRIARYNRQSDLSASEQIELDVMLSEFPEVSGITLSSPDLQQFNALKLIVNRILLDIPKTINDIDMLIRKQLSIVRVKLTRDSWFNEIQEKE